MMLKFITVFILIVASAASTTVVHAQATAKQCGNEKLFMAEHGASFMFILQNQYLPLAVFSQKCSKQNRITEDEFINNIQGIAVSLGCSKDSAVLKSIKQKFGADLKPGFLSNFDPNSLPGLLRSEYQDVLDYCSSIKLAAFKKCGRKMGDCDPIEHWLSE